MNIVNCTRCEGTGFLNLHQLDEEILKRFDNTGDKTEIEKHIETSDDDVCYCDCCEDGSGQHDYDIEKHFNCM